MIYHHNGARRETVAMVPPANMATAEPAALQLGGYYERSPEAALERQAWSHPPLVAAELSRATAGKHLAGVNVAFDAAFLERFLRCHGQAPAWRYHLIDVKALIAGKLYMAPPWPSKEIAELVPRHNAHTALADAIWAEAIYIHALGYPWQEEQ